MRFLLDSSGDLTHALNYDPYGVPLQPNNPTTLGFTGEQTDPNDLLYLRARYYHPKLGAFTSVDPVLGVGGSTGWKKEVLFTLPMGAHVGDRHLLFAGPRQVSRMSCGGLAQALPSKRRIIFLIRWTLRLNALDSISVDSPAW